MATQKLSPSSSSGVINRKSVPRQKKGGGGEGGIGDQHNEETGQDAQRISRLLMSNKQDVKE